MEVQAGERRANERVGSVPIEDRLRVERATGAVGVEGRGGAGGEGVGEVVRPETGLSSEAAVEGDGAGGGAIEVAGTDEDVEQEKVGAWDGGEQAARVGDGAEVGEPLDELGGSGDVASVVAGDDGLRVDLVELGEGGAPGDQIEVEGPEAARRHRLRSKTSEKPFSSRFDCVVVVVNKRGGRNWFIRRTGVRISSPELESTTILDRYIP